DSHLDLPPALRRLVRRLGLTVVNDLALERPRALLGERALDLPWLVLLVVPRDGVLELANTAPERAPHLGQALRPEHDQHDDQHYNDLEWPDVWHLSPPPRSRTMVPP